MRSPLATAGRAVALVAFVTLALACGDDDEATRSTSTDATPTTDATTTTDPAPSTQPAPQPTTAPPTTVPPTNPPPTATPTTVATAPDDPAAAASTAWMVVFDSEEAFEAKAPHLADADALRPTVEAYRGAGSGFGGISLEPTDVVVDGDTATITYDVNFGENPAYGDQVGTIALVDGVWTVSRDEFCSFMASARVSCA